MLEQTSAPFRGTSWTWLRDRAVLGNNELIDPFDWHVYQVAPAQAPAQAQAPSSAATVTYVRDYTPDRDAKAVFDAMHRRVLAQAIARLPGNGRIVAGNTTRLYADAEAVMNLHGPAEAAAVIDAEPLAGTEGVSGCVAVLARAPAGARWRVGCIHLSANDMGSLPHASAAIGRLLASLAAAGPDTNTGQVELYVVGGCEDESVAYEEFARVIGAAQIRAATGQIQLAGALVPACAGASYVDVYIGTGGVTYSVTQHARSGDAGSSGDDDEGSGEDDESSGSD